jgi:tetratricopeptide (TPR) repeat protein
MPGLCGTPDDAPPARADGRGPLPRCGRRVHPAGLLLPLLILTFLVVLGPGPVSAAAAVDLGDARALFDSGKYDECLAACAEATANDQRDRESWWLLKVRVEMTVGRYAQALATLEAALERFPADAPLRLIGFDVYRANGRPDDAVASLAALRDAAANEPWRFSDVGSHVALGRALLLGGADARQVLEYFFDAAKKEEPDAVAPHMASGDLALAKHDYALAAESFQRAAKLAPDDPDVHLGLARSYAEGDAERTNAALAKALELNPRHVGSLLMRADHAVDREDYPRAEGLIAKVLDVNPRQGRAWALRAVMAHLAGKADEERAHRAKALDAWEGNPEVDHAIGEKLSQKYRFAEGAAYQRKSLAADADYRPAKVQLCQDLLRLGEEDEGWALAAEVAEADPYDVVAYNLVTLHENLSKFRTIEDEHFLIRMDPREAEVYGQRVRRLLARARERLTARYGVELPRKVIVEVFPQQKDFAIRTFGLPGGEGFLGVCFGPVITVNSPASPGNRSSNWEAVLWHEFCHSVTLGATRNKMPRWLSEGISVYEERRENPAWGQTMTPAYRELILAGRAAPVSKLSGSFLSPPSPMHLQFAYYESSMAVEYVVERFGEDALRKVLADLATDVPINDALARHTEAMDKLDASFAQWLRGKAEALAPKADLERPELALDADSATMAAWNTEHPNNFWGLLGEGRALLDEGKFEQAKRPLEAAAALYPGFAEVGGPYLLMAAAHRELGETDAERAMLEKHVALSAEAVEPRLRLIELATAAGDWEAVRGQAERVMAVNPLTPAPHRHLAAAAEALGDHSAAIESHRTLLKLDPLDAAEHHYRLAKLLADDGQLADARREVVRALEEAPRFRAAHRLLLEIVGKMGPGASPAGAPPRAGEPAGGDAPIGAGDPAVNPASPAGSASDDRSTAAEPAGEPAGEGVGEP